MKRIGIYTIILVALVVVGTTLPVRAQKQSPRTTSHHTQVSLLSSVKTIAPGTTFTVGLRMTMDPGWHTYWKNSGEAGLPTTIAWTLPQGFSAGEIQWPLPHKYNESGEVLTYGYADENMLLVDISAPAGLAAGTRVTLSAAVDWLECEHICVPGSASVGISLPVASGTPTADNADLFARYKVQVPNPYAQSAGFTIEQSTAGSSILYRLKATDGRRFHIVKDALPDLYPDPHAELVFGRTVVDATPTETGLRIPVSVFEKLNKATTFSGVIVFQMEGGERQAVTVSVSLDEKFSAALPVDGEAPAAESVLDQDFSSIHASGPGQSLALILFFAFVGGLLLNIMPCVLPVIALKIFGLVKMAGDHPQQVKRLGWFFSLGILAAFLALATIVIILQAAGQQVGWGFQFQEPMFVIAMAFIVFAFGLSLFGVYEISLPSSIAMGGMGTGPKREEKGYAASFTEGIFATILATPCTAPFLGAALGFAFSQPAPIILLVFATVAFGMALPYLVLTAKPAWMKYLPKPGEWMVTVKQFMGFLMMGTLIWLLYVLGKQLGMEGVVWTVAFLLCVAISCWMIGRFATLLATRAVYVRTWILAILVAVGGYWFFLESVLNVRSVIAGETSAMHSTPASGSHGIAWQQFSVEQLDTYLRGTSPVFIDFTAEWCLTCKVNEKTVLADESVIEKFKSTGMIPIRADWTSRNPTITKLLAKFGRSGVPLYVIFPAGKPGQPIVLPEVITTGIVLDAIEKATSGAGVSSLQ
jgi:thiol:disulfide interchange protein DsbD